MVLIQTVVNSYFTLKQNSKEHTVVLRDTGLGTDLGLYIVLEKDESKFSIRFQKVRIDLLPSKRSLVGWSIHNSSHIALPLIQMSLS